jgi:hypothetical protein
MILIYNSCLHSVIYVVVVLYLIFDIIFYVLIQRQRSSKINWEWLPVFGTHQMIYKPHELNVMHFSKFRIVCYELQLMDTNAQLWYIIREYITNSEVAVTVILLYMFLLFVFCMLFIVYFWCRREVLMLVTWYHSCWSLVFMSLGRLDILVPCWESVAHETIMFYIVVNFT